MPTRQPPNPGRPEDHEGLIEGRLDAQTVALRVTAGLLVIGAAYLLASLMVPVVLALFLTIALSPIASWLERRARFPRSLAALCCALFIALAIGGLLGLVLYQAGTIVQDSDKYLDRFGSLLASASRHSGGERLMESLGVIRANDPTQRPAAPGASAGQSGFTDRPTGGGPGAAVDGPTVDQIPTASREFYTEFLRRNLRLAGRWVLAGLGGLIGLLGGFVVFIAYIFYMLSTREEWMTRIRRSSRLLGMDVRAERLQDLRSLMVTYIGYLAVVAVCYAIVLSIALWLIGVPQPLLWGVLTGMLEVIPYFGPLIAASLPTIVALSLGSWWQPLAVLGFYAVVQTIEGYVITPLLYGGAIRINPVSVIFGLLFFGWLWGPLGLMTAMPMMILLRGLVLMSPDMPALDALIEDDPNQRETATSGATG